MVLRDMLGGGVLVAIFLAGCASQPSVTAFPPQVAMASGNYRAFLTDNQQRLEQCTAGAGCDVALFNLGFIHAYPQSPYYNPAKAVQYFDELDRTYPHTSWAYSGRAWSALLRENIALEAKQRRLQTDLRTKEGTIRGLRGQMDRSRQLDIQLDKKERELLR